MPDGGLTDGDAQEPIRRRPLAASIGLAILALLFVQYPFYFPPVLAASGHPFAAIALVVAILPLAAFLAGLAFAPDLLQRALSRFSKVDLRDGGHVAAAVVMALTLFYVLGLQTAAGIAAVEQVVGPPVDFEPPPADAPAGAPPAPNLTVNLTDDGVVLNWTLEAADGNASSADAYRIYRGLSEETVTFHERVENATNYTDTGAFGGFEYVYQVTAVEGAVEGAASQTVSVVVPMDSTLLYAGLVENLILFVLPAILYVSFVHGLGPRDALRALGFRHERLLRAILLGVGSVILFLVVAELVARGVQTFQELPENERATAIGLGVGISGAFALAAASSVSEEVLFRGFLQPRIGMWGQAIVFAIAHISYVNVVEVVVVFALALVFGYLYRRTGNLWAPIAAHFAFNFLSVIAIVCTADPAQCGLPVE